MASHAPDLRRTCKLTVCRTNFACRARLASCEARTRGGCPCWVPAMPNGRCRLHGGASPGAPECERNGMYQQGATRPRPLSGGAN
ncbi:HGGxSTG domain-containing protein [Methylobacterium sp. BE186]|uniref:HGGxSTG domain-containing protein n=1 Tax=Methylobacterium sp. BE186 TaxID=2817715 RepID=UPI0038621DCE